MLFGLRTRVGPGNHVSDGGPHPPWEEAILRGGKVRLIVKYRDTMPSCAQKPAEPIEMPFGFWARMGRKNIVLDGGPEVLRNVAMATNFVMQFAITGFVGYNFGCMIASDMLFDYRSGFLGSSYIECLRAVAIATNFGTKIAINWLCVSDGWPTECKYYGCPEPKGHCHGNHFWFSMGYNFGCIVAGITLFDSRCGFSESSYLTKTLPRSGV